MANTTWMAGTHGSLVAIAPGIWTVDGEISVLPIGRRMTIFRDSSGTLVVHSAVACDTETMRAIDALGSVGTIIVPSASHKIDAPRYAARYPDARVLAPGRAHKLIEKVVRVNAHFEELGAGPELRVEMLDGVAGEGVFIHTDSSGDVTLVFNDALMNLPDRLPGFKGWVTRVMGSTGGPKVTAIARRFLVRDEVAFGAHLRRLATLPRLRRIIVSHGALIDAEAAGILNQVADTLGAR